jgi:hypothetical protein
VISGYRLAACACLWALPAAALLIRPDRDDAEYLELATRYTSSVRLNASAGEGVLIAPRWVLTSARVAERLRGAKGVASIHAHPEADIALVLLREPLAGVEPTPAYREAEEKGKAVVVTGHGGDGRKRAGINTVDRVQPRVLGLQVKKGDDASDLQGQATAAEIGAPAYIETQDGLFVAGVRQAVEGDWELYTRVSAFADWIDTTMFRAAADEAAAATAARRKRR